METGCDAALTLVGAGRTPHFPAENEPPRPSPSAKRFAGQSAGSRSRALVAPAAPGDGLRWRPHRLLSSFSVASLPSAPPHSRSDSGVSRSALVRASDSESRPSQARSVATERPPPAILLDLALRFGPAKTSRRKPCVGRLKTQSVLRGRAPARQGHRSGCLQPASSLMTIPLSASEMGLPIGEVTSLFGFIPSCVWSVAMRFGTLCVPSMILAPFGSVLP